MSNKKIGILTSGGDCGGLNAAIRSIFYRAKNKYKMDVYGIRDGTAGLIKRPVDVMQLTHKTFGGYLLRQGGTFLGSTNKGNPFKIPTSNGKHVDKSKEIIEGYHSMKLDGLIIIGGDGSMQILKKLAKVGDMKIVGVRPLSEHFFSLYDKDLQKERIKNKPGLIPPYYVDLPKTMDEIMESELKYLNLCNESLIKTDFKYFFLALKNIFFKGARSK